MSGGISNPSRERGETSKTTDLSSLVYPADSEFRERIAGLRV